MNCGTPSLFCVPARSSVPRSLVPADPARSPAICVAAFSAYLPRPTPMSLRFPGPLLNSELFTKSKCSSVTLLTMNDPNVQRADLLLRLVRLIGSKYI
jgi:hypothetical protein